MHRFSGNCGDRKTAPLFHLVFDLQRQWVQRPCLALPDGLRRQRAPVRHKAAVPLRKHPAPRQNRLRSCHQVGWLIAAGNEPDALACALKRQLRPAEFPLQPFLRARRKRHAEAQKAPSLAVGKKALRLRKRWERALVRTEHEKILRAQRAHRVNTSHENLVKIRRDRTDLIAAKEHPEHLQK